MGRRLRSWLGPARPEALPPTFREAARAHFERQSRAVVLGVTAIALGWWPTDPFVLARLPEALGPYLRWRLAAAGASLGYLLALRVPALRRHALALFTACTFVGCTLVAYAHTAIAGPDRPWFYILFIVPFVTMVLPVPLLPRLALTTLLASGMIAAYVLPVASHRASPFVPWMLSSFLGAVAFSVAFGHAMFLLLRENYGQARALAEQNQALEARVARRTADLRGLLDHLERAREEERTRVARDLHDELGQDLTAMRLALGFTAQRYQRDPASIAANLGELEKLLDRTRASTRSLVAALRPPVLDDLGLAAAADWLVQSTAGRTGLECRLEADPAPLAIVGPEHAVAAFRVLQEAITNTVRHAEARAVTVRLWIEAGALELRVRDDGRGLGGAPGSGGYGLMGMRERAAALGGTLDVLSPAEGGTEVRCRLPLG
jgi:signal transduction histidine kinase